MQHSDGHPRLEGRRRLCHLDAIGPSDCLEVRLGDGDWPLRLIVVRNASGPAVFRNVCPHRGTPLNLVAHRFLTRDRSALLCATHGATFDRESGLCVAGPCVGQSLDGYPAEVDDAGYVWVDLGG